MIARKKLLHYTYLFSSNNYQTNEEIIYKYFKDKYGRKNVSLDFRLKMKPGNIFPIK